MNATPTQLRLLSTLAILQSLDGYPPTIRELGRALGRSEATVHAHLQALVSHGYVEQEHGQARGYTVPEEIAAQIPGRSGLRALRLAWELSTREERQVFLAGARIHAPTRSTKRPKAGKRSE